MKRTILFVSASPIDADRLRVDEEIREIENSIGRATFREKFSIQKQFATRSNDLHRALLDYKPNILHFSGHGCTNGIALEDKNGKTKIVEEKALANLFNLFSKDIQCVILNSCYSEKQAKAIVKKIDFVIGMKSSIPDSSAIDFSAAFYDAMGAGRDIDFAFKLACNRMEIENGTESIPICLKKPGRKSQAFNDQIEVKKTSINNLKRIHSRINTNQFLNIEKGIVQISIIEQGWQSAQWFFELVVDGTNPIYRIRNRWKPNQYLNIEKGLKSSPIEIGWLSAQWIIETTEIGIYKRIRNLWKRDNFLYCQGGVVKSGPIQFDSLAAHWIIEDA